MRVSGTVDGAPAEAGTTRFVIGIVYSARRAVLMQLRDFDETIIHPGQWGFVSGSKEAGETDEAAMRRELWEELAYRPEHLRYHATLSLPDAGGWGSAVFSCPVNDAKVRFVRGEGQELEWFGVSRILGGALPSRTWARPFPVVGTTPRILRAFLEWAEW